MTRRAALLSVGYAMASSALSGGAQSQPTDTSTQETASTDQVASVRASAYDIQISLDTDGNRMEQVVEMIINNDGNKDLDALYLRYYPYGYVPYLIQISPENNEGKSAAITSVTLKGSSDQLPFASEAGRGEGGPVRQPAQGR